MTPQPNTYDDASSGPSDEEISKVLPATIGRPEEFDQSVERAEQHLPDWQELVIADRQEGELYDFEGRQLHRADVHEFHDRVTGSSSLDPYIDLTESVRAGGVGRDVAEGGRAETDPGMSTQHDSQEPMAELRGIAALAAASGAPISVALFYFAIVADVQPALSAALGMLVASIVAGMAGIWYELR